MYVFFGSRMVHLWGLGGLMFVTHSGLSRALLSKNCEAPSQAGKSVMGLHNICAEVSATRRKLDQRKLTSHPGAARKPG